MEEDHEKFKDGLMQALNRHFVGVYGEVRDAAGKVMSDAYSGVLVDVDGRTVVCGAGHCFRALDYFVSQGQRTNGAIL